MLELEKIKQNLREKSDEEIYILARNESRELKEDVRPILIEEIKRRNLNLKLINWIELENSELSILELKKRISMLPCPECKRTQNKIVGVKYRFVISFLRFIESETKVKIFCSKCATKNVWKYIIITFFIGIWGVGLFFVPFILFVNLLVLFNPDRSSNEVFDKFLEKKGGLIAKNLHSDEILLKLIKQFNSSDNE